MMYRCSNSHGSSNNMVGGPCSCGLYHCQNNSSFSMLFSMSGGHESTNHHDQYHHHHHHHMYSFTSPSSVDCTLSLGTPSTRAGESDQRKQEQSRRSSFCWDLLSPNNKYGNSQPTPVATVSSHKSGRGSSNNCGGGGGGGGESLLARRCANCDTTSTPLWRNGPRGPKSLCNACGIRYKKEERRATAAAATNGGSGVGMDHPGQYQNMLHNNSNTNTNNNNGWVHQKMPSCGEFRFVEEDDNFLSWRLNVTDHSRNSYVHDFTR